MPKPTPDPSTITTSFSLRSQTGSDVDPAKQSRDNALAKAAELTKQRLEQEAIDALSEDDAEGTIFYDDTGFVEFQETIPEESNEQTEE